jgi:hypothetical protein
MTKLSKNELMEALAQFGYELNKPSHSYKSEEVLFSLLRENDSRLLEGFPVAYDNILSNQKELHLDFKVLSEKEKSKLLTLLLLTYHLLRLFGEDKSKLNLTESYLFKLSKKWKDTLKEVEAKFNNSDFVKVNGANLATDRLKKQFRNYVVHFGVKSKNEPQLDMGLELHLSQFFTARQKELLKKRLMHEEMTKTEREYYSRVVSKRLKALSDPKLQEFADSLIGSTSGSFG